MKRRPIEAVRAEMQLRGWTIESYVSMFDGVQRYLCGNSRIVTGPVRNANAAWLRAEREQRGIDESEHDLR